MSEPPTTQTITSTSDQRKSVPVVTVESFYKSHAEKLQMKLEGAARRISSQNPRAHHQSSRSGALRFLHLFRGETGAGARRGRAFVSEKFVAENAGPAVPRALCAQDSVPGDVARISSRAGIAGGDGGSKDRGFSHADDYDEVHQRGDDRAGDGFFADRDRVRQHGRHSWRRRFDSRRERHRQKRMRSRLD